MDSHPRRNQSLPPRLKGSKSRADIGSLQNYFQPSGFLNSISSENCENSRSSASTSGNNMQNADSSSHFERTPPFDGKNSSFKTPSSGTKYVALNSVSDTPHSKDNVRKFSSPSPSPVAKNTRHARTKRRGNSELEKVREEKFRKITRNWMNSKEISVKYNSESTSSTLKFKKVLSEVSTGKLPKYVYAKCLDFIRQLPEHIAKDAPGKLGMRREWLFAPYTYSYSKRSVVPSAPFSACSHLCSDMAKALGIKAPNALLLVHYPSGTTGLTPHRDNEPAHASEQVLTFCIGAPACIVLYDNSDIPITEFATMDGDFYLFKNQVGFKHGVDGIPSSSGGRWAFTFRIFKETDPTIPSNKSGNTSSATSSTSNSTSFTPVQISTALNSKKKVTILQDSSGSSDCLEDLLNSSLCSGRKLAPPPFGFSGTRKTNSPGAGSTVSLSSSPTNTVFSRT